MSINFMDAIEHVFFNYAKFDGRARCSEYWYFQLFRSVVLLGLILFSFTVFLAFLIPVFYLGTIVPSLAVNWRRFHDVGRGGWWYFISLVPIIGWIFMVIWLAQDSQPGSNQYGPNPKGIGNAGAYTGGSAGSLPGQGILRYSVLRDRCRDRLIRFAEMKLYLAGKVFVWSECRKERRVSADGMPVFAGSRECRC